MKRAVNGTGESFVDSSFVFDQTRSGIMAGWRQLISSECLRATALTDDLAEGLARMAGATPAFLAVTNGAQDVPWREGSALRRTPVFPILAVDTLAAGDVFHAGFALALAERQSIPQAIRFAAAAAGLKYTRLGGSAAALRREEVEALLAKSPVVLPI
jgi:sulfofructose kinase